MRRRRGTSWERGGGAKSLVFKIGVDIRRRVYHNPASRSVRFPPFFDRFVIDTAVHCKHHTR